MRTGMQYLVKRNALQASQKTIAVVRPTPSTMESCADLHVDYQDSYVQCHAKEH